MTYKLTNGGERDMGILAGQALWDLMYELNIADHYPLVADTGHPDAVYSHLDKALGALFRQLGVDEELARKELYASHSFQDAVRYARIAKEYGE